jgi:hypothetical protein
MRQNVTLLFVGHCEAETTKMIALFRHVVSAASL